MSYKRLLTIQDISCFGQCSITVALPILSACGIETSIIPSAVLSTHTGGFKGYTFRDLSDDMPRILDHWEKNSISFDGFYTGYLGGIKQIEYAKSFIKKLSKKNSICIIDPAMADFGNLYPGFDALYVKAMAQLCSKADIILPNLTEACFLTGTEYKESYNENYIRELCIKLLLLGAKTVVLTGISFNNMTGVYVYNGRESFHYEHYKYPKNCHGTGDVFASVFTGAYLKGLSIESAAKLAADFTVNCIEKTYLDDSHWYGVKFELEIPYLVNRLNELTSKNA